jgi:hypothetical protein
MNVDAKSTTRCPSDCWNFLGVDHLGVTTTELIELIGNPYLGETETSPVRRCEPQQR